MSNAALLFALIAGGAGGGGGDTQIVTVAQDNQEFIIYRGYATTLFTGAFGSIADGTFNPKGGAAILDLYWSAFSGGNQIHFRIAGTHANDGWTTMTINGVPIARSSMSFDNPGGDSRWIFTGSIANPFTGVGTNTSVVFT